MIEKEEQQEIYNLIKTFMKNHVKKINNLKK